MTKARVFFTTTKLSAPTQTVCIPVTELQLQSCQLGDQFLLTDARGRSRIFEIIELLATGCICQIERTAYLTSGMPICVYHNKKQLLEGRIGKLPSKPQALELRVGDTLIVTHDSILGNQARIENGMPIPVQIGCTLPQVFGDVKPNERILFDDGIIAGIIKKVSPEQLEVEITNVAGGLAKLRSEKGINLPDTDFSIAALTEKDLEDLKFIVKNSDMVSLSFVRNRKDIEMLIAQLEQLGGKHLGIVLKIENRLAFENLPDLLLTALSHPPVAIMIARGDLAVEIGFERLAEVQEEILWLCEAAHIPVIWATQVLDSLAKNGSPTRAEVTDAAMSGRAECVMLNKGSYIPEALLFLDNVLRRMKQHQNKKTSMLRRLKVTTPKLE